MSLCAQMNRYETCINCGGPALNGLPCDCTAANDLTYSPMPRPDITPPQIPIPQNRQHAEMMLLVAERYLADNPQGGRK